MRIRLALVVLLAAGCAGAFALGAAARPPVPPPPDPPLKGPPPAWVESRAASQWLGFSTFCWRTGCADYVAPSCSDRRHVPPIKVERGELLRIHLGFDPKEVSITYFGKGRPTRAAGQRRLGITRNPVLRVDREGAFAVFAIAKRGGDASYVGCLSFAEVR